MRQLLLLGSLIAGSFGFGVAVGGRTTPGTAAPSRIAIFDASPYAALAATGSHYFEQLHDGGMAVDKMWTMFVGDAAPDRLPVECEDVCRVRTTRAAYLDAMGEPDLPAVAPHWQRLRAQPAGSFLHVFVMHYPRPDLPGRCITLQATFSTVRDPAFHLSRLAGREGLLFHVRKTYRLDGEGPRLVEAGVEAHQCRPGRTNLPSGYRFRTLLGAAAADPMGTQHFLDLGEGLRVGYAWTEEGSCAYENGNPRAPLTEAEVRALLAFVGRA